MRRGNVLSTGLAAVVAIATVAAPQVPVMMAKATNATASALKAPRLKTAMFLTEAKEILITVQVPASGVWGRRFELFQLVGCKARPLDPSGGFRTRIRGEKKRGAVSRRPS